EPGGVPGGAARELLALEQQHALLAELRQVVGDGAADDAAADDDDLGLGGEHGGHGCFRMPRVSWRLCYATAGSTTGAGENRGSIPLPAESAASGAVPERRWRTRALRREHEIGASTSCPAVDPEFPDVDWSRGARRSPFDATIGSFRGAAPVVG